MPVTDVRHSGNKPGGPGTLKHQARVDRDLPPLPDRPRLRAPSTLSKEERKLWKQLVRSAGSDWFTAADRTLLTMLVRSYLEWEKWSGHLTRVLDAHDGPMVIDDTLSPMYKREQILASRVQSLEKQIGVSITTERRLGTRKTVSMVSEADAALSDIDELAAMRARAASVYESGAYDPSVSDGSGDSD